MRVLWLMLGLSLVMGIGLWRAGGHAAMLAPVASGLAEPVGVVALDAQRLLVVERVGRLRLVQDGRLHPEPFLDLSARINARGQEQGLLGIALDPDFEKNGLLYLNYIRRNDDGRDHSVVARYQLHADRSGVNPQSAQILLEVAQDFANHNGGHLAFGPDGYLYIGLGDGGSANDPHQRSQNPRSLLGKMLRIDVRAQMPAHSPTQSCGRVAHYAIPADNPYADGQAACPEIWALGLRNPWRYSFDQAGRLWIADVGQSSYEEVNLQAPGQGGNNYGWRCYEGPQVHRQDPGCPAQTHQPVISYAHEQGRCSITGGVVYRGQALPHLRGAYLYGDFCTGELWTAYESGGQWRSTRLLDTGLLLAAIGEDAEGEVLLLGLKGELMRLMPGPHSNRGVANTDQTQGLK